MKLKLLYDISGMNAYEEKNSNRTGIFFCIYNILIELSNRSDVELYLYSEFMSARLKKMILNNDKICITNIKFYNNGLYVEEYNDLVDKINVYSNKIEANKWISKIMYRLMRKYNYVKKKYIEKKMNKKSAFNNFSSFDAYLSPFNPQSEEIYNSNIKKFTMIYDIIPIKFPFYYLELNYDNWYKNLIKQLNKNDYYFTISNNTKEDIINTSYVDEKKIITSYIGPSQQVKHNKEIQYIKLKYKIPEEKKYIFSLCSLEPRKNIIFSIEAFISFIEKNEIQDLVFVLGGSAWKSFLYVLEKKIQSFANIKDSIIFIGYVDDEDISTLYSNSEMLIYPSLYEGFGMPILEAMQNGIPVIASNTSSMPEVLGNAGILINPYDKNELINAIEQVYFNISLREKMINDGYKQADKFKWSKSVNTIVEKIKAECL